MALRQPPIIQLDSEFVTGRMIDLLLETYVLLGFKTPVKEDVSVLAAKLVSDILRTGRTRTVWRLHWLELPDLS